MSTQPQITVDETNSVPIKLFHCLACRQAFTTRTPLSNHKRSVGHQRRIQDSNTVTQSESLKRKRDTNETEDQSDRSPSKSPNTVHSPVSPDSHNSIPPDTQPLIFSPSPEIKKEVEWETVLDSTKDKGSAKGASVAMSLQRALTTMNNLYDEFTCKEIEMFDMKTLYCEESQTNQIIMSDDSFRSLMGRLQAAESFQTNMLSFPHKFPVQDSNCRKVVNTIANERGYGIVQYIHPPKEPHSIMRYKADNATTEIVDSFPTDFQCSKSDAKWNDRIKKFPVKSYREMKLEPSNIYTDEFSDEDDSVKQNNTFYSNGGSMKGYRYVSSKEYRSKMYTQIYGGTKLSDIDINFYKYKRSLIYENRNKLREYQIKTLNELLPEYLINPFCL